MIEVKLHVSTSTLSIEGLTSHLGREPSRFTRRGDFTPAGPPRRWRWSYWELDLHGEPGERFGLSGINRQLHELGVDFARRLGSIPDPDRGVGLEIVQAVEDDPDDVNTSNFIFSEESIQWLATARARIMITQYLYPEKDNLELSGNN
ncbi:hypothetical protein ACFOYW_09170 [Gryllotalpicola reticulitermitis]|uniref:DUF4279 domain-containing protein n=1 Tax=Gryllotalpicola reticulitermitis TaxID=1184153 RepID=A0ABV8Q710_9MICO